MLPFKGTPPLRLDRCAIAEAAVYSCTLMQQSGVRLVVVASTLFVLATQDSVQAAQMAAEQY
jgi:hypothetical protein